MCYNVPVVRDHINPKEGNQMIENVYVYHHVNINENGVGDEIISYVATPSEHEERGFEGSCFVTRDEKSAQLVANLINKYIASRQYMIDYYNYPCVAENDGLFHIKSDNLLLATVETAEEARYVVRALTDYIQDINEKWSDLNSTYHVKQEDGVCIVMSDVVMMTPDMSVANNFNHAINNFYKRVQTDALHECLDVYEYCEDGYPTTYHLCRPYDYKRSGIQYSVFRSVDREEAKLVQKMMNEYITMYNTGFKDYSMM